MKKVLFISDGLASLNINSDSTYLMILTAAKLEYEVYSTTPNKLYAINNQAYALVSKIECKHKLNQINHNQDWYATTILDTKFNLDYFDLILVRNDPPFNMEYFYLTQILNLVKSARVINSPFALRNFNEKLSILNFPKLISPSLISRNKVAILDFVNQYSECVIKPIDLMAGRGVFKLSINDPNFNPIIENVSQYFTQSVMVQQFIPEVIYGDRRIFIVNGVIIDHCLCRIPQNGQIRGNLAAGGRGEVHPLNVNDYEIARQVAPWLLKNGIYLAGIDVIHKYLTEINITSPTAMQQIYHQTGINVAFKLFESL